LGAGDQAIPTDSLEEVARRLALGDIPSIFDPRTQTIDRGWVLEQTWKELDLTFFNLRDAEREARIPSMIFSPMLVEDGRSLLISNRDLTRMTEIYGQIEPKDGRPVDGQGLLSRPSLQLFSLFPTAYGQFKVRTAVRMSATFPYVTPSTNLPTDPPYRVVDA